MAADGDGFSPRWIFAPVGSALWQIRWASPGSRDRRKPALKILDLTWDPPRRNKNRKRLVSLELWNNGSSWIFMDFGDLLFSRWYYLHKISSICWLHRIIFCWSQVRNAFIGFCSAAVSDTCAVAQWIAGQLAEKTPDTLMGWNTHLKLRVFEDGPMTPNKNAKGKNCGKWTCLSIFLQKDCVFFCNVSKPPPTHTHTHLQRLLFGSSTWWTCWNWPPTLLQSISGSQWIFPTWCICSRMMWHVILEFVKIY